MRRGAASTRRCARSTRRSASTSQGTGGGTFYLNIRAGRMSAEPRAAHAPFLTLIQDRRAFERLAHEAGDSALALLGGLAGIAGEITLTHARVEGLRAVDGLVRFEVTGEDGFVLGTHFGAAPIPAEPKTRITPGRRGLPRPAQRRARPPARVHERADRGRGRHAGGDAARARGGGPRLTIRAGRFAPRAPLERREQPS